MIDWDCSLLEYTLAMIKKGETFSRSVQICQCVVAVTSRQPRHGAISAKQKAKPRKLELHTDKEHSERRTYPEGVVRLEAALDSFHRSGL